MSTRRALTEILVRENIVSLEQLEKAKAEQKQYGGRLTSALVKMGFVRDGDLAKFLGDQYQISTINLKEFEVSAEVVRLLPRQICEKHGVFPVSLTGTSLVVAFSDPSNLYVKDDLSLLTRKKIEVVVASEGDVQACIEKYHGGGSQLKAVMSEIEDARDEFSTSEIDASVVDVQGAASADGDAVIKFVNAMLAEAIKLKASDIHVEPYEKRFRVRFRADGNLIEKSQPPRELAPAIVSRLKVISRMDIGERRKPQDGRLKVKLKSKDVDFRVNSIPTLFGEKVVLRLLDKSNLQVDLTKLGFEQDDLDKFKRSIGLPQGLVLITGPTGSGKTTTIYSALAELNSPDTNISTAEDPVEFNLDGINQVQVNPDIGFGFSEALRAFLRQDPDVIMVGEIRDLETAQIAYKAGSTGHLVVSTLHTNDAASTITRLVDMGIPRYLVAEGTTLIVAQRLIKKNCTVCLQDIKVSDETLLEIGVPAAELDQYRNLKKGDGCATCNYSGLSGRLAIYEVMQITTAVKEAIFKEVTPIELKRHAIEKDKMRSLRMSALLKLKAGLTTIPEVLNVSVGDFE